GASEVAFGFVTSGAAGAVAIAGSANATLIDSDTAAFIDHDARVNNGAGANAAQTVHVSAYNHARIFCAAGNITGGVGTLAGGIDVGLLRNDVVATLAAGADVRAAQ